MNFIQQAPCALTSPDSYDFHPRPGIGPLVEVTINERFRLTALVDTGSTLSLITDELCDRLTIVPAVSSAVETFTMLDGTELPTRGTPTLPIEVGGTPALPIEVGGTHTDVLFHCLCNLPSPILLGIDFVRAANLH